MAKKKLNEQQVIQRILDCECPRCGSADGFVSGIDDTFGDGMAVCTGKCDDCGARWAETYVLSEVSVDPTDKEEAISANAGEELLRAASNFLSAYGGDIPDWLESEAKALGEALQKAQKKT